MNVTIKDLEPCRKELSFSVPKEQFEEEKEAVFKNLIRSSNVPGFRPGKAPRHVLEQRYGKDVSREVIQNLIPKSFSEAVKTHGLSPVEYPEISDVSLDNAGALSFKAVFDISPQFTLKKYKGLALTRHVHPVTDEEVANSLKALQEQNAQYIAVPDDQGATKENFILCDYSLSDKDVVLEKRESTWLESISHRLGPKILEGSLGMKKGESREIKITVPDNYTKKEYAGKPAVFSLTVKELKAKQVLACDDEFAKDLGFADLAALEKAVRDNLESRSQAAARDRLRHDITKILVDEHPFDVPPTVVARHLRHSTESALRQMLTNGMSEEDAEKEIKSREAEFRSHALESVKAHFVILAIAKAENISVSDEEVRARLTALASYYRQKLSDLEKNKNLVYNIEEDILKEKTFDGIASEAKITETE